MRSLNKGFFFVFLILLLGATLVFKSGLLKLNSNPRLIDRLPTSDYLVRLKSLGFSKEINAILFKYKLPVREFASPDFLLSQAKHHGINIQSEAYLFFNQTRDEWGGLVPLTDSSKIINGIERFRKNTEVLDSSIEDVRVFHFPEIEAIVAYEKNYLFIYRGNKFKKRLEEIRNTKQGSIRPSWKRFLSRKALKNEKLVVYTESPMIKEWGFDYGLFAHDNDTVNLHVKCLLYSYTPHGIKLKSSYQGLDKSAQDSKSIELHLHPSFKTTYTGKALMAKLNSYGRKISFPTTTFFDVWNGDLSFREGGVVNSTQKIVVSEFDENFNVREVIKYEQIQVPGYAVVFNTHDNGMKFINAMFAKGLLHTEEQRLRFLFSPLLRMNKIDSNYMFTSAAFFPPLVDKPENHMLWSYEGTPFLVTFEKIRRNSIELNVQFQAKPLIKYLQKKKTKKKEQS